MKARGIAANTKNDVPVDMLPFHLQLRRSGNHGTRSERLSRPPPWRSSRRPAPGDVAFETRGDVVERVLEPDPGARAAVGGHRIHDGQPALAAALRRRCRRCIARAKRRKKLGRLRVAEFAIVGAYHLVEATAVHLDGANARQTGTQSFGGRGVIVDPTHQPALGDDALQLLALPGDHRIQSRHRLPLRYPCLLGRIPFVGDQPGLPGAERARDQQQRRTREEQQTSQIDTERPPRPSLIPSHVAP